MKTNRSDFPLSPVIAAAAMRRPRHFFLEKKGRKARNNYLAETDLSCCKSSTKPGASSGNRNALKHGLFSTGRIAHRRRTRQLRRDAEALINELKSLMAGARVLP